MHNKRPLLWTVVAFILVVAMATILSIWWNMLLVQNHRILRQMTAVATDPSKANLPLALLMVLGLLCSVVLVLGLVYLFLRLIKSVQINLAQSQFIAAVTHELRSPVASLQILLETIRDPTTSLEKRREFETLMETDLKRLRTLVDQVLDTARLENFTRLPAQESINLRTLLESCSRDLEPRLKPSHGVITISPISPELRIHGQERLLQSAFLNILDNAVKYSSGPAKIEISVFEGQEKVLVDIRDHGIGLRRKEQKKVFKRFYRAGDPLIRSQTGTGLGLYFARLAIRAQGGNISAKSDGLGLGTTFRIELTKTPQERNHL